VQLTASSSPIITQHHAGGFEPLVGFESYYTMLLILTSSLLLHPTIEIHSILLLPLRRHCSLYRCLKHDLVASRRQRSHSSTHQHNHHHNSHAIRLAPHTTQPLSHVPYTFQPVSPSSIFHNIDL
jgi:hypothetical protein